MTTHQKAAKAKQDRQQIFLGSLRETYWFHEVGLDKYRAVNTDNMTPVELLSACQSAIADLLKHYPDLRQYLRY